MPARHTHVGGRGAATDALSLEQSGGRLANPTVLGHNAVVKRPRPVVAAVVLLSPLVLGGCDAGVANLIEVAEEREANRVLVALEQWGITAADKQARTRNRRTTWVISVPPEQAAAARQVLVSLDLPRPARDGLDAVGRGGGLVPSRTQERARLMHAVAAELERTLETYDGVVTARVHLAMPEDEPLAAGGAAPAMPSAVVVIKTNPRVTLGDAVSGGISGGNAATLPTAADVAQIVARSFEGMRPEAVYVTFTPASALAVDPAPGDAVPAAAAGRRTLVQLYAACALLGLVSIGLLIALVRKGKANGPAVATVSTPTSPRVAANRNVSVAVPTTPSTSSP